MKPWLTRLLVATAMLLLTVAACYHWVDIPLARAAHGLGWQVHLPWEWVTRIGLSVWYLTSLPVLALVFWISHRPVARNRCAFIFLTVMWSGLAAAGLKFLLGRARPRLLINDDVYGFEPFVAAWERNAMPSGHATTIAALAACLWVLFPRWRWLWVALALPVIASRVIIATHYLSDVLVSIWLAVVIMLINLYLLERWGLRLRAKAAPSA